MSTSAPINTQFNIEYFTTSATEILFAGDYVNNIISLAIFDYQSANPRQEAC